MSKSRNKRHPGRATAATRANGHMPPATSSALAVAEQAVERAKNDSRSKQPRFADQPSPSVFYERISQWIQHADLREPGYSPDSRERDKWLRAFWRLEPHLAGVVSSVVSLDKNRGWSLTGGRNQVYRVTDILHNAEAAPGLYGWRNYFSSQALSHYATDVGLVAELGRDGRDGPLRALYHTDSARCRLTGNPETPLEYEASVTARGYPVRQAWEPSDFFRVVSMPSDDETFNGLGYCAVSRLLELAKLMCAIFRHDQELLGARMPDGLLLLQGITQEAWDLAMADREAQLSAKERKFFGGVFVLASAGIDEVDAKLVALRQLPANFNLQIFTDLLMFSYALAFGYSPREFWPVSSGALGTATEAETQDDNSTGKGESDLILNYQERLQDELPDSVAFEFDARDAKGDLEVTQILQAKASFVDQMARLESGGMNLLTGERVMQLAAEHGLIPDDWLVVEGDVEATDTESAELSRWRERARVDARVQRAVARFPREPIVRYCWPTGREVVLFDDADAMTRRRVWGGADVRRRDLARLTASIDRAAARLENLPAPVAAMPAHAPITIVTSADGAAHVLRQAEPVAPVIHVHVPEQPAPVVNVNVPAQPAPTIENVIQVPATVVNVEQAQAPDVHVHVPKQSAPVVNVAPAAAPVVNVTVPEPQVTIDNVVQLPPQWAEFDIKYDRNGKLDKVIKTTQ